MKKRRGMKPSGMPATLAVVLCLAMLALSCSPVTEGGREATGNAGENQEQARTDAPADGPFEGLTLLAPLQSNTTYLADSSG